MRVEIEGWEGSTRVGGWRCWVEEGNSAANPRWLQGGVTLAMPVLLLLLLFFSPITSPKEGDMWCLLCGFDKKMRSVDLAEGLLIHLFTAPGRLVPACPD